MNSKEEMDRLVQEYLSLSESDEMTKKIESRYYELAKKTNSFCMECNSIAEITCEFH